MATVYYRNAQVHKYHDKGVLEYVAPLQVHLDILYAIYLHNITDVMTWYVWLPYINPWDVKRKAAFLLLYFVTETMPCSLV